MNAYPHSFLVVESNEGRSFDQLWIPIAMLSTEVRGPRGFDYFNSEETRTSYFRQSAPRLESRCLGRSCFEPISTRVILFVIHSFIGDPLRLQGAEQSEPVGSGCSFDPY